MAWNTPTSVSPGDAILASLYNEDVVDNLTELAPFFSGWTSWTPTIAQGTATNITKTLTYSKYLKIGRMVIASLQANITGTGQANNAVTSTLPVTAAQGGFLQIGHGNFFASGGNKFPVYVEMNNSTTVVRFQYQSATADQNLGAAGALTTALTNGQTLTFQCIYESAS